MEVEHPGPPVARRMPRDLQPQRLQRSPGRQPMRALEERAPLSVSEAKLEEEDELWTEDAEDDHSGWFCVATEAFPCPAPGCTFVAMFMTATHLILVWQERDDPNLLRHAQRAKEVGRNPRVSEYKPQFGPSASYYAWEAAGRPVHGIRAQ